MPKKTIEILFQHDRTTKNYEIYQEVVQKPGAKQSMLYLTKKQAHELGYPFRAEFSIDEDGESSIQAAA